MESDSPFVGISPTPKDSRYGKFARDRQATVGLILPEITVGVPDLIGRLGRVYKTSRHIKVIRSSTEANYSSMTQDAQEMIDLFQGPVKRAMAKSKEEEHKGMATIFEKMLQNFTWHVLEEQGEDFRGFKTFLLYKVQVEGSKEASLGGFVDSKSKEEGFLDLIAAGRVHPTIHSWVLVEEEKSSLNQPPTVGLFYRHLYGFGQEEIEMENLLRTVGRDLPSPMSYEEDQNRNNNEGPSDPLMEEVVGTFRSLQQQMGNIERNVGALSARMDKQDSMLGQRKGSTILITLPRDE
ncbi:hypothetical protein M9H77_12472 [Catharanthus roseus]|uniref:Uncharacterized protein n=1 Tax=Catharanthus roseus TaxID=4058 RepID=A0ACC0BHM7_CATRO|nr:hypothetical protein M9H77_12472 [Catharanthus roseus]